MHVDTLGCRYAEAGHCAQGSSHAGFMSRECCLSCAARAADGHNVLEAGNAALPKRFECYPPCSFDYKEPAFGCLGARLVVDAATGVCSSTTDCHRPADDGSDAEVCVVNADVAPDNQLLRIGISGKPAVVFLGNPAELVAAVSVGDYAPSVLPVVCPPLVNGVIS